MKKPNIIYILADDMGYGDISRNNPSCPFTTPHLDNLCTHGMRFTDAHASSAVCTPSRYSLLTGRYNWRSRLKSSVTGGYSEPIIAPERKTVAHMLQEQGYWTAMVGKWHLGLNLPKNEGFHEEPDFAASDGIDYQGRIAQGPRDNGFDYFYGISASLDMPPYVFIENEHFTSCPDRTTQGSGKGFWRKGPTAPDFHHEQVLDRLTDTVVNLMEERAPAATHGTPFFIYFPMPAPHTPILPSARFKGISGTNDYGDFVLHCDDVVGRIVSALKKLDILEDTLVIYTSDNGCSPMADYAELQAKGHNPSYIFRGTKSDIYEGGHRIPLIVQWPASIPAHTVCDRLVCLSDFMATMADLLDIPLPDTMGEDSVSNLPLWRNPGGADVREDLVHQSIDGSLALRRGKWKLAMCPGSGGWSFPRKGIDDLSHLPSFQLYDMEADISETHNVYSQYPHVFAEMKDILAGYIRHGRSTPGTPQENEGIPIWEAIQWFHGL